jgi:hypothetical protein
MPAWIPSRSDSAKKKKNGSPKGRIAAYRAFMAVSAIAFDAELPLGVVAAEGKVHIIMRTRGESLIVAL